MSTPHLTRSEKADLWATGIAGLLTIGAAIGIGVIRMLDLFPVSGGITVTAPVTSAAPTQSLGSVQAQPTMLEFTAQDVNALSVGALITEIILTALGYIAIVLLVGTIVRRAARGPAFPQGTAKLVNAIAIVLIAMSAGGTFLKVLGYNGAFAAVDAFDLFDQQALTSAAVPFYVVAVALGALALTFRRGEALQRETEGLI